VKRGDGGAAYSENILAFLAAIVYTKTNQMKEGASMIR